MCFVLLLRGVLRHFFLHRHMNIRRGRLNFGTKMAMDIIYIYIHTFTEKIGGAKIC